MLGTLNNLTALDLPKGIGWVDVLSNYALAPFLTKLLVPGMAQNDVVLEVSSRAPPQSAAANKMRRAGHGAERRRSIGELSRTTSECCGQ